MPRLRPGHLHVVIMPPLPIPQLALATVASAIIAAVSVRYKLLSVSGGFAALVLGIALFGLGGLAGALPLIAFFVPSSLLSLMQSGASVAEEMYEKGSRRDARQVLANGGVAGLLVVIIWALPNAELYVPLVASLGAASADTWGTELGGRFGRRTVSITTWRSVPPGTSGGLSLIGTLAGVAGATVTGLAAITWLADPARDLAFVVAASLCGSMADSLVGATLQRRFQCGTCGLVTERSTHCNEPAHHQTGLAIIDNDAVNLICTATAAVVASILVALA